MSGLPYRIAPIASGENRGQLLFLVNTDYWETDLQSRLDDRTPGEPESLSLCAGAEGDLEFLHQLCNATLADKLDNRGNAKLLWVKKDESAPNDLRDAVRYGIALATAWVEENGGCPQRSAISTQSPLVVNPGERRPDGRSWSE